MNWSASLFRDSGNPVDVATAMLTQLSPDPSHTTLSGNVDFMTKFPTPCVVRFMAEPDGKDESWNVLVVGLMT